MGKYVNQNNMTRLGLEHLKSFATRGVIIDLCASISRPTS